MIAALAFSALAGSVGLHIEQAEGLPIEEAVDITRQLGRAIEARTGASIQVDSVDWTVCREARCIQAVGARTQATELVMIRVLRGLATTRIIAQRLGEPNWAEGPTEEVEVGDSIEFAVRQLARQLFPVALSKSSEKPAPEPGKSVIGLWFAAGSAVVGAIGLGFGISSLSARSAVEGGELSRRDFTSESARVRDHAVLGNALITTAVVGVAAGGLIWLLD